MKQPEHLFKTTFVIWSDYDPNPPANAASTDEDEDGLVALAREACSGDAYCSRSTTIRLPHKDYVRDPDWDGTEFFGEEPDDVEPCDEPTEEAGEDRQDHLSYAQRAKTASKHDVQDAILRCIQGRALPGDGEVWDVYVHVLKDTPDEFRRLYLDGEVGTAEFNESLRIYVSNAFHNLGREDSTCGD